MGNAVLDHESGTNPLSNGSNNKRLQQKQTCAAKMNERQLGERIKIIEPLPEAWSRNAKTPALRTNPEKYTAEVMQAPLQQFHLFRFQLPLGASFANLPAKRIGFSIDTPEFANKPDASVIKLLLGASWSGR